MVLRTRDGLIEPCLPKPAKAPPSGPGWIHEIKHDGFRIIARRDNVGVRLLTRNGHDFSVRFPAIAAAVGVLPVRSCVIDGEAIVSDETGLAVFELIRRRRHEADAIFCAFDLLEFDGEDLRRLPIEDRKAALANLLRRAKGSSVVFNEHFEEDGATIYRHACAYGCEGIVSKHLGSPYRGGRTDAWLKVKNPAAPAVRRELGWRSCGEHAHAQRIAANIATLLALLRGAAALMRESLIYGFSGKKMEFSVAACSRVGMATR
jgi:bifunctional non-homologous end joining protein LigD